MLKKSSVFIMMVLLAVAASLIGIISIYQYEELQVLPAATAQSQQQQTQIADVLVGRLLSFGYYSSSDGKACTAFARISEGITKLYPPNRPIPLGLKPGNEIVLVAADQTMCVVLGQVQIAKMEIQFQVALPPVTTKALPPTIQKNFPPDIYPRLYRIVWVSPPLNLNA